jgi:exonuclease III
VNSGEKVVKVGTWNVNGIRARASQVQEWMERERPDVVCLQELKAELAQVPDVVQRQDYHAFWHCYRGYSGVSLQLRKEAFPRSCVVQADVGTSDHAPVVMTTEPCRSA